MKQIALKLKTKPTHGGKRAGSGRPNLSGRRAHIRRPKLSLKEPVHVTLRLAAELPSLRRKDVFRCFRQAVKRARAQGLAVSHFAILSNHVHLILEPQAPRLTRVFQSLCISFAKRLNRLAKRKGAVFHDRYHTHVLKTPREVKNAIAYVISNEARHEARHNTKTQNQRSAPIALPRGPYSSAHALPLKDVHTLFGKRAQFEIGIWPEQSLDVWFNEILTRPKTWLLTHSWLRA